MFLLHVVNEDEDLNPVFRFEDSIFEGIDNINQLNTHKVKIEWENKQRDGCEFDYKGKFILARNRFGFLTDKVSFTFEMYFKTCWPFVRQLS